MGVFIRIGDGVGHVDALAGRATYGDLGGREAKASGVSRRMGQLDLTSMQA